MAYEVKTLGYALECLSDMRGTYYIPAMQRKFVWSRDAAIGLFDSIYQGFPIGSTLIWPTTYQNPNKLGALKAYSFPVNYEKDEKRTEANLNEGQKIQYVLDGQQRLTTLNICIRGGWYENKIRYQLYFNPLISGDGAFSFCTESQVNSRLIPCSDILKWVTDSGKNSFLALYFNENHNLSEEQVNTIETNVEKLRQQFWQQETFSYGVFHAKSLNDALEVFILSNNSGIKLDKSDLIIATFQTAWEEIDAGDEIDSLYRELNRQFEGSNPFSRKSVLKLFLAVAPCNLPIAYSIKSIKAEHIKLLEEYWPEFKRTLFMLINVLKDWGMNKNKLLNSVNALIPILRWINHYDNVDKIDSKDLLKARNSLLITLATGAFGGNSDSTISDARNVIDQHKGKPFPFAKLNKAYDEHQSVDFTTRTGIETFLTGLNFNKNSRYKFELLLMMIRQHLNTDASYSIEYIFEGAQFKAEFPESYNRIENICMLTVGQKKKRKQRSTDFFWTHLDGEYRQNNHLPIEKSIVNTTAIYNEPKRLWEGRKASILDSVCAVVLNEAH